VAVDQGHEDGETFRSCRGNGQNRYAPMQLLDEEHWRRSTDLVAHPLELGSGHERTRANLFDAPAPSWTGRYTIVSTRRTCRSPEHCSAVVHVTGGNPTNSFSLAGSLVFGLVESAQQCTTGKRRRQATCPL
jgi:hypothetical protein